MKKGFTLVELIVVLAIIGILTLIVIGSTESYHTEARDQRREADLKEIQIDLAQYYDYYREYPASLSGSGTTSLSNFVLGGAGNLPTDPQNQNPYYYAPLPTSGHPYFSYCIGAALEGSAPSDNTNSACGSVIPGATYTQQPPQ